MKTLATRLDKAIINVPDFPKEGILFKDISPVLLDVHLSEDIAIALAEKAKVHQPDAICGVESRGYLFGTRIAQKLGISFIMARKAGKLPRKTIGVSYDLEYGSATLEISEEDIQPGAKILIHDDFLATGGTAKAVSEIVLKGGGQVAGYSFLVDLTWLKGQEKLAEFSKNIDSLLKY